MVVAEDQARNVFPPDFDPLSGRPGPPPNEAPVTTPPDCGPARCLYRATAPGGNTSGLFVSPRDPVTDVAFAPPNNAPYGPCPFTPGDPDPDPVLAPGAPILVFYQIEGADIHDLRATADYNVESVRIWF